MPKKKEAKFTPGPWEIVTLKKKKSASAYRIRQKALRYPHIKSMDSHLLIAELYAHRFGSADNTPGDDMNALAGSKKEGCQRANAHLIAAAPKMLTALEVIAGQLSCAEKHAYVTINGLNVPISDIVLYAQMIIYEVKGGL